jgi:hypothetical protein
MVHLDQDHSDPRVQSAILATRVLLNIVREHLIPTLGPAAAADGLLTTYAHLIEASGEHEMAIKALGQLQDHLRIPGSLSATRN